MRWGQQLGSWARRLKRDVTALWIAARCRETPLAARLLAAAVAAYALSPIDLIPDFIPVLGYLDDIILIPLGIAIAIRLIPPPLMARFRDRAAASTAGGQSVTGAVLVVASWLAALALCWRIWT